MMGFLCYGTERLNDVMLPRKASLGMYKVLVPQTDTGIRDEYSKARELNLHKELCKIALYLRYKRRQNNCWFQQRGPADCLAKTQLSAKSQDDV